MGMPHTRERQYVLRKEDGAVIKYTYQLTFQDFEIIFQIVLDLQATALKYEVKYLKLNGINISYTLFF
jgi:hypothetical protein